jgi:transposase InsO family protein
VTPDGVCLDELAVISYRPADFTYCPTWDATAYVSFVIDAFSRRITGWRAATTMTTALVLDALEHAVWARAAPSNSADRSATDTSTGRRRRR